MSKVMLNIKGIADIAERYQVFLVDLYGVIHDGARAYPGAVECILYLRDMGKQISFFSNTPRPHAVVQKGLINIHPALAEFEVVTSGDYFVSALASPDSYNLPFLKEAGYHLGWENNQTILNIPGVKIAKTLEEASYVLLLAYTFDKEALATFDSDMQQAIALSLPCLCLNPDLAAPQGDLISYPGGAFALRYQGFGGKAYYTGKPYSEFYEYALKDSGAPKSSVLAIGDNLNTDIKGANNYGLDSVWIKGESRAHYAAIATPDKGAVPTPSYILDALVR